MKKTKFLLISSLSTTLIGLPAVAISCNDKTNQNPSQPATPTTPGNTNNENSDNNKTQPGAVNNNTNTNTNTENQPANGNENSTNENTAPQPNTGNETSEPTPGNESSSNQGGSTSEGDNSSNTANDEEQATATRKEGNKLLVAAIALETNLKAIEFNTYADSLSAAMAAWKVADQNTSLNNAQLRAELQKFAKAYQLSNNAYTKTAILDDIKKRVVKIQEWYMDTISVGFSNPMAEPAIQLLGSIVISDQDKEAQAAEQLKRVLEVYHLYQDQQEKINTYKELIKLRDVARLIRSKTWLYNKKTKQYYAKKGANDAEQAKIDAFNSAYASTIQVGGSYKVKFSNTIEEMQEHIEEIKQFNEAQIPQILPVLFSTYKNTTTNNSKSQFFNVTWYKEYKQALLDAVAVLGDEENPSVEKQVEFYKVYVKSEQILTSINNKIVLLNKYSTQTLDLNKVDDITQLPKGVYSVLLPKKQASDPDVLIRSKAASMPPAYKTDANIDKYERIRDLRDTVISEFFSLVSYGDQKQYQIKDSLGTSATKVFASYLLNIIDFSIQFGLFTDDFLYTLLIGVDSKKLGFLEPTGWKQVVSSYEKLKGSFTETSSKPSTGGGSFEV